MNAITQTLSLTHAGHSSLRLSKRAQADVEAFPAARACRPPPAYTPAELTHAFSTPDPVVQSYPGVVHSGPGGDGQQVLQGDAWHPTGAATAGPGTLVAHCHGAGCSDQGSLLQHGSQPHLPRSPPILHDALARVEGAGPDGQQLSTQNVEDLARGLAAAMQPEGGRVVDLKDPAALFRFGAALLRLVQLAVHAGRREVMGEEAGGAHGPRAEPAPAAGAGSGVGTSGATDTSEDGDVGVDWLAGQLADGVLGRLPWLCLLLQHVAAHPCSPDIMCALAAAAQGPKKKGVQVPVVNTGPWAAASPALLQLLVDALHTLAAPAAGADSGAGVVGLGTQSWDAMDAGAGAEVRGGHKGCRRGRDGCRRWRRGGRGGGKARRGGSQESLLDLLGFMA